MNLDNPWRFANRRDIAGLSLFTYRLYHPQIRRWLTTDPLGFEDGLNLYAYVQNNPLRYTDPDGQWAFVLPLFEIAFGEVVSLTLLPALKCAVGAAFASVIGWKVGEYLNDEKNDLSKDETQDHWDEKEKEIEKRRGPTKKD